MIRLPKNRPPTHPGVALLRAINKHGLTQTETAQRLGISFQRLNAIVNGRRGITADTALRLEKAFGVSVGFWLQGQLEHDLWHAMREDITQGALSKIQPFKKAALQNAHS